MSPNEIMSNNEGMQEKNPTALLEKQEKDQKDVEGEGNLKYPRSVFFIVGNEFCERFSFYGMRAILTMYLKYMLLFSEDTATVIFHTFTSFCYFTPLFGAIIADTLLGRYRTIFYISIVYAMGNVLLSLSATPPVGLPTMEFSLLGLALIAIGTGGIKPCVSAFGGDQFVLPQQEKQLKQFFSVFYFSINAGSLISTVLTPILREDVKCFNSSTCYPLAFGVPAILMILALFLFLFGKSLYIMKTPKGNILITVVQCIKHALARRFSSSGEGREHWLDYAEDKYDKKLIQDVKALLKVLFLYLPLPLFWALFDQQGSRWTFQATRMDGNVFGYTIKPDQMQVVNPLLILAFIPFFETVVYPLLAKCKLLTRPLQRITVGGLLAASAFVISGLLELQLEKTYAVLPKSGESDLRVINGLPCPVEVSLPFTTNTKKLEEREMELFKAIMPQNYTVSAKLSDACRQVDVKQRTARASILAESGEAFTVIVTVRDKDLQIHQVMTPDSPAKSHEGQPKLRIFYNLQNFGENGTLKLEGVGDTKSQTFRIKDGTKIGATDYKILHSGTYKVVLPGNDSQLSNSHTQLITLKQGGVYHLLVQSSLSNSQEEYLKLHQVTKPNSIHMLWLIPQYFLITSGEIMFSITGLEFSFTQAPSSMKSVVQAAWLLTVAFGNLIVVIVAEAKFFQRQSLEFFLFAGLMGVDMIIFMLFSLSYKYVDDNKNGASKKDEREIDNKGFVEDDTKF